MEAADVNLWGVRSLGIIDPGGSDCEQSMITTRDPKSTIRHWPGMIGLADDGARLALGYNNEQRNALTSWLSPIVSALSASA